jgi:hypothetical protein
MHAVTHRCETWVLTKASGGKILALERKCCRMVLRINWRQRNHKCAKSMTDGTKIKSTTTVIQMKLFGYSC